MPVTHGVAGSSPVQTAFYFSFLLFNIPFVHIFQYDIIRLGGFYLMA